MKIVNYFGFYEFYDVIADIDNADIVFSCFVVRLHTGNCNRLPTWIQFEARKRSRG